MRLEACFVAFKVLAGGGWGAAHWWCAGQAARHARRSGTSHIYAQCKISGSALPPACSLWRSAERRPPSNSREGSKDSKVAVSQTSVALVTCIDQNWLQCVNRDELPAVEVSRFVGAPTAHKARIQARLVKNRKRYRSYRTFAVRRHGYRASGAQACKQTQRSTQRTGASEGPRRTCAVGARSVALRRGKAIRSLNRYPLSSG